MEDKIYSANSIEISTTLAKFGTASYPIASIGSVRVDASNPFLGCSVLLLIGGCLAAGAAGGFPAFIITGVILGLLVYLASKMNTYKLMLRTGSGDSQAFQTGDAKLVNELKSAIETAVVRRG